MLALHQKILSTGDMQRKGNTEFKSDVNKPRDLNYYINDVHLISCILIYLSLREIRAYSYTCKENRELTLHLGLIQYKLSAYSRFFMKMELE